MAALGDASARILAFDFGTSGVTVGLYNPGSNKMEAFGEGSYQDRTGLENDRWIEQDPRDWVTGMVEAMASLRKRVSLDKVEILGIGIGGHMHALAVLDEKNEPALDEQGKLIRGGVMWNDPRGEEEGQALSKAFDEPIPARLTASRVRWFAANHATAWQNRVKRVAVPSSFIALILTGSFGVGPGDASGMVGQLDGAGSVSDAKLKAIDPLLPGRMPRIGKAGEVLGKLNASGAKLLGLPEGIPVAYPEGDQPIGMVASGCVLPGQASISLGNSVVFNAVGTSPILTERGAIDSFRTATGDHLLMTCVTSGTVVFDQVVELFRPIWPKEKSLDELRSWLTDEAAAVPPGCYGVVALPFYLGEGVFRQPNAFASLLGFHRKQLTAGVLTRASMEATSLVMRYGYDQMKRSGLRPVERLVLSGGGSQSTLWPQIIADVFGVPVVKPQDAHEAATRGSAYLALFMVQQQAGNKQSLAELVAERVQTSSPIQPRLDVTKVYEAMLSAMFKARDQVSPLYDEPWFHGGAGK
jgi:xylulokinase